LNIEPVVLYHITDTNDLPKIEEIIKNEDEEAFTRLGGYFKTYQSGAYLLNSADVGEEANAFIQQTYDLQGGFEVCGTKEDLREFECLLDSPDCYACRLERRLLILPQRESAAGLVKYLQVRALRRRRKGWRLLFFTLTMLLLWPLHYCLHEFLQEPRLRRLSWQSMMAISLLQFLPMLAGFLVGSIVLHSPGDHSVFFALAYLSGGFGMLVGGRRVSLPQRKEEETPAKSEPAESVVEYEGFPLTDIAAGFMLALLFSLIMPF
jgi:hypothetical protein